MATVALSPIGNGVQFLSAVGVPRSGGLLNTYQAGTTSPLSTFTTNLGTVSNANPITLNSDGTTPSEVWLVTGNSYKFVLTDAGGGNAKTYDNIPAINDISPSSITYTSPLAGGVAITLQAKSQQTISVMDFGAKGDGTTDDTTAVQTAITAVAATGGLIWFPQGTYKITSTLTVSNSGVYLHGAGRTATKINYSTGANDLFLLQGAAQIQDIYIGNMTLKGSSLTGGNAINAQVVAYLWANDLYINTPYNGILCYQTNTVVETRVDINNPSGTYAHKWDSPTTNNSSALTLDNCTFAGGYLGADGFIWDGWTTTLRMKSVAILSFRYGMRILNTRASTTAYPSFGNFFDVEIDGASTQALDIEAGATFHFDACDITNTSGAAGQGSADLDACLINPDTGLSVTRQILFTNTRIGNTQRRALNFGAKDLYVSGCTFEDSSKAGSASYPCVEFAATASDISISGGKMGIVFGETARASYGLKINSGVLRATFTGVNFYNNVTGDVQDLSASNSVVVAGCMNNAGTAVLNTLPAGIPVAMGGYAKAVNINATGDTPVSIYSPWPNYLVDALMVRAASGAAFSTARIGVYTSALATGITLSTQAAPAGLSTSSTNSVGNVGTLTIANIVALNLSTLYLNVGTPQGAAATIDFYTLIRPLP